MSALVLVLVLLVRELWALKMNATSLVTPRIEPLSRRRVRGIRGHWCVDFVPVIAKPSPSIDGTNRQTNSDLATFVLRAWAASPHSTFNDLSIGLRRCVGYHRLTSHLLFFFFLKAFYYSEVMCLLSSVSFLIISVKWQETWVSPTWRAIAGPESGVRTKCIYAHP